MNISRKLGKWGRGSVYLCMGIQDKASNANDAGVGICAPF